MITAIERCAGMRRGVHLSCMGGGYIISMAHAAAAMRAQAYLRPRAKGKELLLVTRCAVAVFGIFTGLVCVLFNGVRLHF